MSLVDFIYMGFESNSKSASEFAKVQASLDSNTKNIPIDIIWLLVITIGLIIAISILLAIFKNRHKKSVGTWFSVNDPGRITTIFKRAVSRNASFTLEIFSVKHVGLYRGTLIEARECSAIVLELAQAPKIDSQFDGLPAQVHINFRPSTKAEMEHYQFSTKTLSIDFVKEQNWRSARVTVAWPKNIISAQRRDFLRLEPVAQHTLNGRFYPVPEEPIDVIIKNDQEIACGLVLDISLGGAQLSFNGIVSLNETQRFMCFIDLPLENLSVKLHSSKLYLLVQMMTQDIIGLNSSEGDKSHTKTIVRVKFIGRYFFNPHTKLWTYSAFNVESMQDLSHWMHAYQRFELQKEKGLLANPSERMNIYPAVEIKRPPIDPMDQ